MTTPPRDPAELLNYLLYEKQLKVTLTPAGRLSLKPKKHVTAEIIELVRPHQKALVALLHEEHAVPARDGTDPRPAFDATVQDLKAASDRCWTALASVNDPPSLFRRSGLTWIERDDLGRLAPRTLNADQLRHWLSQRLYFVKPTPFGEQPVPPPGLLLDELIATPEPAVPILTRVVGCPLFAKDGALHDRPGYDPRTRCWLDLAPALVLAPISPAPSAAEIATARRVFSEPFAQFPCVSAADRAHLLAVPLTLLARELIDGCTPLFVGTKPAPGTGATLALKTAILIPTGLDPAVMTHADDDAEMRKKITAALLDGPSAIFLDNVTGLVDSAALSAVLTSSEWRDRLLGHSREVVLPNRAVWVCTSNNALFSTELSRRAVRIKFDAAAERPWQRAVTFDHPNLLAWARDTRGPLIHAGLTLISAWLAHGRPAGTATLASFQHWSEVLGGILAVAGIPGFLENVDDLYAEQDPETDDAKRFLTVWWIEAKDRPQTTSELAAKATRPAVALPLKGKDLSGQTISMGHWLRRYRGRYFDLLDATIVIQRVPDSSINLWKLTPSKAAPQTTATGSNGHQTLQGVASGVGDVGDVACHPHTRGEDFNDGGDDQKHRRGVEVTANIANSANSAGGHADSCECGACPLQPADPGDPGVPF